MCLAALAVVALGATSCKKDVNNEENGMQFRAIMETGSAKTELSGTNVNWIAGDEVMIYGTEQSGVYTATPDAENATAATLTKVGQPAQNATTVTLPAVQQSEGGNLANTFPMYAQSTTTTLNFMNLCGVLKIHLQQEGATVSRISVTATTEINGNFSVDNSGEAPAISYVEGGNFTTTLICSEAQDITNGKDFYIYMPAGEYSGLKIMIMNAGYGVEKNAPANATITIERSKYSTLSFANVNMPIPPDDVNIWGLYSVSATQQVWIASGNLQFNKTIGTHTCADGVEKPGTWRFATHQWDRCGWVTNNSIYGRNDFQGNVEDGNSYNTRKWVDLFQWGATGYNGFNAPRTGGWGRNEENDYQNDRFYEVEGIDGTYYDWGEYVIGNGWRTLTNEESSCLMAGVGTVDVRYGKNAGATVEGIHGMLLIPDIWNGPAYSTAKAFTSNVFTAETWAEMESFGAVFLPCCGNASSTLNMTSGASDKAYYWTATAGTGSTAYADNSHQRCAQYLGNNTSNTGNLYTNGVNEYKGVCAVRLCKNYVPTPANE